MEYGAGSPQKDDSDMPEMGSENLLVEIFLSHAIMAFKVVGCGDSIPNPTSGRILSEILAKFREFSGHSGLCQVFSYKNKANAESLLLQTFCTER
jgi:hypothetical protein